MKFTTIFYLLSQFSFWAFYLEDKNEQQLHRIYTPQYFIVSDSIAPPKADEKIFIGVDQPPKFPKGEEAMKSYIIKRAKYTDEALKMRVEGRVIVQFVVGKDGSIAKAKVIRGLGYGLDETALEIVLNMPHWKPGYHEKKVVSTLITINVPFTTEGLNKYKKTNNNNHLQINKLSLKDTTFYNRDWELVDSVSKAFYYDVIRKSSVDSNKLAVLTYYSSGQIMEYKSFFKYKRGLEDETILSWYQNGKLKSEINYVEGLLNGETRTYWENEKPKRIDFYEIGILLKGKCFSEDGSEVPHFPLFKDPEFPGGRPELREYLINETSILKNKKTGSILFSLSINEQGKVVDIKIHENSIPNFEKSLLKAVNKMPYWIPGTVDGNNSRTILTMPLTILDLKSSDNSAKPKVLFD